MKVLTVCKQDLNDYGEPFKTKLQDDEELSETDSVANMADIYSSQAVKKNQHNKLYESPTPSLSRTHSGLEECDSQIDESYLSESKRKLNSAYVLERLKRRYDKIQDLNKKLIQERLLKSDAN